MASAATAGSATRRSSSSSQFGPPDRQGETNEHGADQHYGNRERTPALDGWLYRYNHHRRHSAIGRQPPITRLNNLLGSYI
jgi:hypothetical protein